MVVVCAGRGHLGRVLGCNRRFCTSMETNLGSAYTHSPGPSAEQQELSPAQQQQTLWQSVQQRQVLGELQVAPAAAGAGAGNSSPQKQASMHSPLQPYGPPSPPATSSIRMAGVSSRALPSPPPHTPHLAPAAAPVTPFQQQLVTSISGLIPVPPTPAWDAVTPAPASCMGQGTLWDPFTPWLKTSTKQPMGLTPAVARAQGGHGNTSQAPRNRQQQEQEQRGEGGAFGGIPYTGGSATVSIPSPATLSPLSSTHSSLMRSAVGSVAMYHNQQQQQQQACGIRPSITPHSTNSLGVARASASSSSAAVTTVAEGATGVGPAQAMATGATAPGMAPAADLLARRLSFGPDSPLQQQLESAEQGVPGLSQGVPMLSQDASVLSQEEAASPSLSEVLRRHLEGSLMVGSGPHSSGSAATTPATSGSACSSPRSSRSTPGSASSSRSASSSGGSGHAQEEGGGDPLAVTASDKADTLGTATGLQPSSSSSSSHKGGGPLVVGAASSGGRSAGVAPAEAGGDTPAMAKRSPASVSRSSSRSSRGSLEDSDIEGEAVIATTARRTVHRGGGGVSAAGRLAPPASLLRRRVLLEEDEDSDDATSSGTSSSSSNSSSSSSSRQRQVLQGRPRKAATQQQQQRRRSRSRSRGGSSSRQAAAGAGQGGRQQGRRVMGQAAQARAHPAVRSESEGESEYTPGAGTVRRVTSSSSSSAEDEWQTPQQQQQQQRKQQKRGKQVKGGGRGQQQQQCEQHIPPKGRQQLGAAAKGGAPGGSSAQGTRGLLLGTPHRQNPPRLQQEGLGGGSRAGGKGTPGPYTPMSPAPLLDRTNTPSSTPAAGKAAGGQQLRTPEGGVLSNLRTPPLTGQGGQQQGAARGGGVGNPSAGKRSSGGSGGRAAGGVAVGVAHLVTVPRRRNTQFTRQRVELAQTLYTQWNQQVFAGRLPPDLPLVWNPRLATTAGQVVDDGTRQHLKTGPGQRIPCRLELSPKVLDCESRLRSTLAHEMCHVAAWVVDREFEPHHGRAFKAWAGRFQAAVAGVDITTRHDYQVFRPFKWECTNARCKKLYERNKQSIDPGRHACGLCKGPLRFLGKFSKDGTLAGSRKGAPNAYSTFVQAQFSAVKEKLPPGTPTQAVMRKLADVWREEKKRQEGPAPGTPGSTGWVVAAGSVLSSTPGAATAAAVVGGGRAAASPRHSRPPLAAAAAAPVVLDLVSEEEGIEGLDSPIAGVARERRRQQQQQQPQPGEGEVLPSLQLLSIS